MISKSTIVLLTPTLWAGSQFRNPQSKKVVPQKSPHPPPLGKGGMKSINFSSSPFAKGGPGGILVDLGDGLNPAPTLVRHNGRINYKRPMPLWHEPFFREYYYSTNYEATSSLTEMAIL